MAEVAAVAFGIKGLIDFVGSLVQSDAQRDLGKYQKHISDINASTEDMKAEDAIARGQQSIFASERETAKLKGTQRAAYAGQGVKVDSGSARDIVAETDTLGEQDKIAIGVNARKEAWGYRTNANNIRQNGRLALAGANNAASNTIMTGGLNFLSGAAQMGYGLAGGVKTAPWNSQPSGGGSAYGAQYPFA